MEISPRDIFRGGNSNSFFAGANLRGLRQDFFAISIFNVGNSMNSVLREPESAAGNAKPLPERFKY